MIACLVKGMSAGLAATVPMTAAMVALHRQLPWRERYPLPPRQITERLTRRVAPAAGRSRKRMFALTVLSHFAYGAAMGAIYAAARTRPQQTGLTTGALFGLLVWAGSYFGLLPALDLYESPQRHPARRNLLMIAAHLVFGSCVGAFTHLEQELTEGRQRDAR